MTNFKKIKKLVSRQTKDFQAISEHMLLQNCGAWIYLKMNLHKIIVEVILTFLFVLVKI